MITQTESGLTAEQYLALQDATGNLSARLVLQQYGPVWTTHDTSEARAGSNFDAAIASTYLLRVYVGSASDVGVERLADESGGDETWASITCTISDVDTNVSPSLIADGLTARVFYYSTGGKIRYTECADISSGSFGAAQDVGTVSDVIHLAAVSTTKVYYITKDSDNNRRLHVYEHDGSWSSASSDIYWPFPIYGFDAVTYTDFDLLMMGSELPPLIGSRAVGTEVTTKVERVQGLVAFRVSNGRWSNHEVFDVTDLVKLNQSRADLRLSFVNSILFASYTRTGGSENHTYSKLAATRSKDGLGWEFPELVEIAHAPGLVLPRSDYLYLVGVDRTMRSPRCAWASQTPVELEVSDAVMAIESQVTEIRNTRVGIANVGDACVSTLAKSDNRIQAVHELGYVTGGEALRVQVSVEDIVSRAEERMLPRRSITLSGQDRLGRLNRVASDYAAEWPSQQAGRDAYNDPTGTGYGGLRHTAPYEGSWKASAGICKLVSSNMEGLAVSTFVSEALNGSVHAGFQLNYTDKGEYAGVAFRIHDKDNLFFAAYYADDDKVRLKKVTGGTATTLATSAAMGWTINGTNWYYLMARAHYGLVYVYYSTDGVTWSVLSWDSGDGELPGIPDFSVLTTLYCWSGKFGLIGYAYSEEDTWPGWTPSPWPVPTPAPDILGRPNIAYARITTAAIYRTENWQSSPPTWVDVTGTLTNITRIGVDQENRYVYAQCAGGLYKASADTDTPVWLRVLDSGSLPAGCGYWHNTGMSVSLSGHVCMYGRAPVGCTSCGANIDRQIPVLVTVAPNGTITVLGSQYGCPAGNCCPVHDYAGYWKSDVVSDYHIAANGNVFSAAGDCRGSVVGGANHFLRAGSGDGSYSMTNEEGPDSWGALNRILDLGGGALIGLHNMANKVYRVPIGCGDGGSWVDITPANFVAGNARGFDRDACVAFGVLTDGDRVYGTSGSSFTQILYRADISATTLYMTTCYADDPDQLFLATGDDILWTIDKGLSWSSKRGALSGSFREIRVVWTKPEAE